MYGGVLERCVPACFNGLNYSKGAAIVPVTREDAPLLAKELDKSTYKVSVHFSTTITETICEKIKRIRRNEVQQIGAGEAAGAGTPRRAGGRGPQGG